MIRFLHTSDWQLGMTRHFLSEGAQERYSQARFDAIRTMGRIAKEEQCRFVLVCGDAFESNQVDRKTVARAMEALKEVSVPVFILPGNHDPLNAASVYRSSTFIERKPAHVQVVENAAPIRVAAEVELVGAPWLSKRPATNPLEDAISALGPADGVSRICLAHGAVDTLTPDRESAGIISVAMLEQAIIEGKIHFAALGDRHSLTKVGDSGRIWYSGTPESTDFRETQSGYIHIVEIGDGTVASKGIQIGQWRFIERERVDLNTADDVEALRKSLEEIENKDRTVVRLSLVGSLTLTLSGALQNHILAANDVFGAFDVRADDLLVLPDHTDFANLGFSGFADGTVQRLRSKISEGRDEGTVAREALILMLRLARETV
ncbi:exonuclease subunit SbcD [Candidatus Methylomirabilis lanthanidiphila]|uniref:Exonuclease subunit SbcD n=1 Tax=Candidatus Methylomirabilis lanthanidiphila TaxID=2211376 RepID=A0A564ZEJ2_9BACT|nr:metallophosphoesterase [Candidatus Methylomirabilis lanthanidiphila]VUZ83741.1 exonuclease subunit SbcD [Candidatus Methylomirabilis lanthanidiphila]